jgi:large subunit ribosomal protein L35
VKAPRAKLKTHRGAAKRFKVTATGKVRRSKAYHSHILSKKSTKRKRRLRKGDLIHKADLKNIRALLPYA